MNKKKSLTPEQVADAGRLKAFYEARKKDLGITQQSIADDLDATQGAVGHYLNGRNALNLKVASAFARLLKINIAEFSPSLAKEAGLITSNNEQSNVSYAGTYKKSKRYPLISEVTAGAWTDAAEPYDISDISEWFESEAKVSGQAFWLKVTGDSMTAPTGVSIPENTLVLFDTGRDPINGSLVLAKLTDANEATFKKLIIDGGQKYLRGLNPAWPLVAINGNCRIIGVAVETKMKLV